MVEIRSYKVEHFNFCLKQNFDSILNQTFDSSKRSFLAKHTCDFL